MKKNFYLVGIVLLALAIVTSVLQSILYLLVHGSLFTLDSFTFWFLLACAISFGASFILLKYYHYRKYTLTFWIAIVSTFGNLCQQGLFYLFLLGERKLMPYYTPVILFELVMAIAYALSLIFSAAAQRIDLKRVGLFSLPISIVVLILVVTGALSGDMSLKISIQKAIEWVVLLANVLPFLLLLNFLDEIRNAEKEDSSNLFSSPITDLTSLISLVAIALTLGFGLTVSSEAANELYWKKKNKEEAEKFVQLGEVRSFTNRKGETLKYALVKPKNYDPNKKYPLVVSLPYDGYEASAAEVLASGSNPDHYPAFLFVPFCPEGAGWGGIPNYPTIDTLVFDALLKLEEEVSIDVNRRYVTGVSRGGYGSWHFITARPDMFAAAIPVCGGGNPERASTITQVSVWAFHGALDRNVPVSGSRNMIEAIKKVGGNPKYTEFPDKAHNIWYEVSQTPGLWDWLFEQKRDSTKATDDGLVANKGAPQISALQIALVTTTFNDQTENTDFHNQKNLQNICETKRLHIYLQLIGCLINPV